jgi:hypothetical protein
MQAIVFGQAIMVLAAVQYSFTKTSGKELDVETTKLFFMGMCLYAHGLQNYVKPLHAHQQQIEIKQESWSGLIIEDVD